MTTAATDLTPNYDASREAYRNALEDMDRETMIKSALFLFKLGWDRGDQLAAATKELNALRKATEQ